MSHPTQTKDPKPAEHPAVAFAIKGLRYMRDELPKETHFNIDKLGFLPAECTDIDINSGSLKDGGLKVLELRSFDDINVVPEVNKLLQAGAVLGEERGVGNWYSADDLCNFYCKVFELVIETPGLPEGHLIERISSWRPDPEITDECVSSSMIHWRGLFTLHMRDNSMPDMVCFLANEAPLEDDKIARSELRCILRMGASKLRKKEFRHHKIAPVTLVSASGIYARIVQGYSDGESNCLVLRKSRIIRVDGVEKQSLEGIMKIACWLLGNPCRKTS
ncbi:hypothetical protein F5Y04DRAFT_242846 [Hypomontagnella monticulosa]|nr:hypothetical protein F5Y04DRAFT_242846 [Hypomontagnella monticulosa]